MMRRKTDRGSFGVTTIMPIAVPLPINGTNSMLRKPRARAISLTASSAGFGIGNLQRSSSGSRPSRMDMIRSNGMRETALWSSSSELGLTGVNASR